MLILTQDKQRLELIETSAGLFVYENEVEIDSYGTYKILGAYKNEQRAKEVLKQIYNRYDKGHKVFEMPEE